MAICNNVNDAILKVAEQNANNYSINLYKISYLGKDVYVTSHTEDSAMKQASKVIKFNRNLRTKPIINLMGTIKPTVTWTLDDGF